MRRTPLIGGSRMAATPRSLASLVFALFFVIAALVAVVFAVLLVSVDEFRTDLGNDRSAHALLIQSFTVEQSVLDLETGIRGYLLTDQPSFLAPYQRARLMLPAELAEL